MLLQSPHNHPPPLNQEDEMAPDVDRLAMAHGRSVFSAAYRVLGDAGLAEDIQQGVFLQVLEKPPRREIEHWGAYLCSIATRAAIDELRRRHRWQRLALRFGVDGESLEPLPQDVLDEATRARRLRRALARLPRRQAECFALRFFDGLALDDIARSLGVTNNVVSVALNRATHSLRRHVESLESSQSSQSGESGNQESQS
jgi:RNA polymerase sigma-70 factor (ECF subfamily)